MKRQILLLSTIIIIMLIIIVPGCAGKDKKSESAPTQVKEQYQCPMKCTQETFDKSGKCPVCEMDVEKISDI